MIIRFYSSRGNCTSFELLDHLTICIANSIACLLFHPEINTDQLYSCFVEIKCTSGQFRFGTDIFVVLVVSLDVDVDIVNVILGDFVVAVGIILGDVVVVVGIILGDDFVIVGVILGVHDVVIAGVILGDVVVVVGVILGFDDIIVIVGVILGVYDVDVVLGVILGDDVVFVVGVILGAVVLMLLLL